MCFHCFVQNVGNRARCGEAYQNGKGRSQRQASQNGIHGVPGGCGGSRGEACPPLQGHVSGEYDYYALTLIQHICGWQINVFTKKVLLLWHTTTVVLLLPLHYCYCHPFLKYYHPFLKYYFVPLLLLLPPLFTLFPNEETQTGCLFFTISTYSTCPV